MSVMVALKARAGQYIFCEQVVRVNQEQFHFGYIKLYTLVINPTPVRLIALAHKD